MFRPVANAVAHETQRTPGKLLLPCDKGRCGLQFSHGLKVVTNPMPKLFMRPQWRAGPPLCAESTKVRENRPRIGERQPYRARACLETDFFSVAVSFDMTHAQACINARR